MGQTFTRVNKSRKEGEVVDQRKSINQRQTKNLDKHRKQVYNMIDTDPDDMLDDDNDLEQEHEHS